MADGYLEKRYDEVFGKNATRTVVKRVPVEQLMERNRSYRGFDESVSVSKETLTAITQATAKALKDGASTLKGFFDKLEDELPTIHNPVVEEMQQLPGKGTPIVRSEPKVGRNDPCPCGSGKKYKKCCGAKL